jgi:hypothetical protein
MEYYIVKGAELAATGIAKVQPYLEPIMQCSDGVCSIISGDVVEGAKKFAQGATTLATSDLAKGATKLGSAYLTQKEWKLQSAMLTEEVTSASYFAYYVKDFIQTIKKHKNFQKTCMTQIDRLIKAQQKLEIWMEKFAATDKLNQLKEDEKKIYDYITKTKLSRATKIQDAGFVLLYPDWERHELRGLVTATLTEVNISMMKLEYYSETEAESCLLEAPVVSKSKSKAKSKATV